MVKNQFSLLRTKKFLPLFITQFFGAFNDNVYKNALVILITYSFSTTIKTNPAILITLAAGIFILPFFLFSALAGQLADKFEKAKLIRYTKVVEIFLAILASVGFHLQNISLLMSTLFLLGTQAAFFGPIKYSILPNVLPTDELIGANALLESGTFLAILLGTLTGGALAAFHAGPMLVSVVVTLIAILGYITSLFIPTTKTAAPDLIVKFNLITETKNIIQYTMQNRQLMRVILAISWFWLIGATYLSQFPTYAKDVLRAESSIVTLFLTCFTFGIGIGSMLCNRLLKGQINARYVPIAALGMTLFAIDLFFATHRFPMKSNHLLALAEFLNHWQSWRIIFDLLLLSACGGLYTVPLYTIMQHASEEAHRSRVIACNNIMNALFMIAAAIITSLMLSWHFSVDQVFLLVAIINFIVVILWIKK